MSRQWRTGDTRTCSASSHPPVLGGPGPSDVLALGGVSTGYGFGEIDDIVSETRKLVTDVLGLVGLPGVGSWHRLVARGVEQQHKLELARKVQLPNQVI